MSGIDSLVIEDSDGDEIRVERNGDRRFTGYVRTSGLGVNLTRAQVRELRDHLDALLGEERKASSAGRATIEVVPEIDGEAFARRVRSAIADAFGEIADGVRG